MPHTHRGESSPKSAWGKTPRPGISFEQGVIAFSRIAIFVVYFWFGILKVVGTSPASPLVASLLEHTLPFIKFPTFLVLFGLLEMAIGILFLIPRLEWLALALFIPHMITTCGPLVLLPPVTWQSFLTPTLAGQYIIKNVVLVALALSIVVRVRPSGARAADPA